MPNLKFADLIDHTIHHRMISIILISLVLLICSCCQAQQQQDPSKFNGGSILAMSGRNSVAIAIDSRFGLGFQTISTGERLNSGNNNNEDSKESIINGEGNPRIIQLPNSNTLLAWSGLYGDGISFTEEMNILLTRKVRNAACMGFSVNTRKRKKMISPRAITMLMSTLLYRRRNAPYYVEPVVVGLEDVLVPITLEEEEEDPNIENENVLSSNGIHQTIASSGTTSPLELISTLQKEKHIIHKQSYKTIQKPYLCGTDMLGAQSTSTSFVCSGVASRSLHGTAEALWKPNLDGEELVEICGRAFVSALERDILSGYGAVVYLIQGGCGDDGMGVEIIEYVLACRND